jgi:hypothetical protein
MNVASSQLGPVDVRGLRDMAHPPMAPNTSKATGNLEGVSEDDSAPNRRATTVMPPRSKGFCAVPKLLIDARTMAPGATSMTRSPIATTGEIRRLDRLEANWPTARATAATRSPVVNPRRRASTPIPVRMARA